MVLVSVIIPTFNRKDWLIKCINSVEKQGFRDYEIIVIDNGSSDGTVEYLKGKKGVRIIENKNNLGASVGRNQAVKIAKGEYLWFLDSDAEAKSSDCLRGMIRIISENPGIGQIGGELVSFDGDYRVRISNSERNQDGTFIYKDSARMREVDYVATSNCFMRRDALIKVGGFDPGYFYGYEDNDVGFQLRKLGYKNLIDDEIMAYHYVDKATRVSNFFRFHRNRIRFLIKKESFLFLIALPVIDFYTNLKIFPKRVEELKKRGLEDIAWLNKKGGKNPGMISKVATVGTDYCYNLFLAYLWNIANLPKTLNTRTSRRGFL